MHLGARWFPRVFGELTEDAGYAAVREHFLKTAVRDDSGAIVKVGGGCVGTWRFDSVKELREAALAKLQGQGTTAATQPQAPVAGSTGGVTFDHVVGDVSAMHAKNPGCMFQAASQFNCLEFVSPNQQPEEGIARYVFDRTQGPACAIACPYATAHRNYTVACGGGLGQERHRQLDGLADLGGMVGNSMTTVPGRNCGRYWTNTNGYVDSDPVSLAALTDVMNGWDAKSERGRYRDAIRVGVHLGAQVGYYGPGAPPNPPVKVGQTFCSAIAVGYSRVSANLWEPFARLVLEAAYEATLWATVLNHDYTSSTAPKVFLTKLGGGVFGNEPEWIVDAIKAAVRAYQTHTDYAAAMDILMVHYGAEERGYVGHEYVTKAPVRSSPPSRTARIAFRHDTRAALESAYAAVDSIDAFAAHYTALYKGERGDPGNVRGIALHRALMRCFGTPPPEQGAVAGAPRAAHIDPNDAAAAAAAAGRRSPAPRAEDAGFKQFLDDLVACAAGLLDASPAATIEIEPPRTARDALWCRRVLANAFLGNITADPALPDRDGFNMSIVFLNNWEQNLIAAERVSALVEYFMTSAGPGWDAGRQVVWERAALTSEAFAQLPSWGGPIRAGWVATHAGGMEAPPADAFVNFANTFFNFGQWIPSCTQEEVLQTCCPEHNVGMLFYARVPEDGAVLTHGVRRYAHYTGYGDRFKCKGAYAGGEMDGPTGAPPPHPAVQSVLAIDAVTDGHHTREANQRDVRKAFVAFRQAARHVAGGDGAAATRPCVVSTGAWGCGVFGGHRTHKFLQQVLAANLVTQPGADAPAVKLWFSNFGRDPTSFDSVVRACSESGITCGELYDLMSAAWTSDRHYDDVPQLVRDIHDKAAREGPRPQHTARPRPST